jgi:hypothetical protein
VSSIAATSGGRIVWPGGGAVQRLGDLAAICVLGQVAPGAGLQRGDDRVVVGVGGEHDDRHLGMLARQPLGRADAVEHRHVQVEEDRVGLVLGDRGERLLTVGDRGDDLEVGHHVEHHLQPLADDRLIVCDHDSQTVGA